MLPLRSISNLLGARNPERYLKSALWIISARFASLGVSLIATFYIARSLGPQNFGELNYALSVLSLLAFLAALASGTIISRDLVREPNREPSILGSAWIVSCIGSIATLLLLSLFVLIVPHDRITLSVLGILVIGQFFTPFSILKNVFIAKTETKYVSLANLFVHVIVSAAKVLAMLLGGGVLVLAVILLLEQFFSALTLILLYRFSPRHSSFLWKIDWAYAVRLATHSLPFVVLAFSSIVSGRLDQVFLRHFIDTTTVGYYSVAVQLSELWHVLPIFLVAALYPAIVNARVSPQMYRKRLFSFGVFLLLYGFAAASVMTVFAPHLVPLIYGDAFIPSIPVLQLYSWSMAGIIVGFLVNHFLATEHLYRVQIIAAILPTIINIALNMWWIPLYGMQGAAAATVISYALAPCIPFVYPSVRKVLLTLNQ
jgi:O-antigen/teichoic acid export membrane protein